MFNWSSYILLYPFLRCSFARLEAAILLFDFVTVQFSDIYILPYIFDTLFRKPCHLTSHQVSDRHEVHTCCSIPQCRTFISYTLIKIMNNAGKMMIVISDS